jgi:hypothetical protein
MTVIRDFSRHGGIPSANMNSALHCSKIGLIIGSSKRASMVKVSYSEKSPSWSSAFSLNIFSYNLSITLRLSIKELSSLR